MRFRLGKKKNSIVSDNRSISSLPPPAPSLLKPDSLTASPRRDRDLEKRSVQFRDNRLPDGKLSSQVIPRPRMVQFESPGRSKSQGRWSPTPSILSTSSQGVYPTLSSYPASYTPSRYLDYPGDEIRGSSWVQNTRKYSDTYEFKSNSLRDFGRVSSDYNVSQSSRNAYAIDIPRPDYPPFVDGKNNMNRDSGLDTDSRSSSGVKPNFSDLYYNTYLRDGDVGVNYADKRKNVFITEGNTNPHPNNGYMKFKSENNGRRLAVPNSIMHTTAYDHNPIMFKAASLSNLSGRLNDNYSIPEDMGGNNNNRQNDHYSSTLGSRSRNTDWESGNLHCSSCSCCHDIRDEIGRYCSVATSTDETTTLRTKTSSLSRVELDNSHTPKSRNQLLPPLCREFEWKSIGNTEDFIYRPRSHQTPKEVINKAENKTTRQSVNSGKRLPRCEPNKGSSISTRDLNMYDSRRSSQDSTSDYQDEYTQSPSTEKNRSKSPVDSINIRPMTNSSFIQL